MNKMIVRNLPRHLKIPRPGPPPVSATSQHSTHPVFPAFLDAQHLQQRLQHFQTWDTWINIIIFSMFMAAAIPGDTNWRQGTLMDSSSQLAMGKYMEN